MIGSISEVFDAALALSEQDRGRLASKLIESLDDEVDPDAEVAWAAEIERRLARIDAEQSQAAPTLDELMRLPLENRVRAARLLLESLDEEPEDPQAEALRAAELTRRARAVADGTAKLVDADEVRRRVAARLRTVRGR
jgi:putative addiction module component (TIGR02574 family)